jgi:acetyl esterase
VIVYYHGGGFVIADLNTYDASPRALSHPHRRDQRVRALPPGAGGSLPCRAGRCLRGQPLSGGERREPRRRSRARGRGRRERGGNLAANVAIAARDGGVLTPVAQILVYPVAGVDMNTPPYHENENAKPLNKAMLGWFFGPFLRSDADRQDPRIDIIGRANLASLPPTTVVTAGIDPLMDDGQRLAERLQQSGVPVASRNYPGATHEFFGMSAVDLLDGARIKLTRNDPAASGAHHFLPLDLVASVDGRQIKLNVTVEQARRDWQRE